MLLPRPVFVCPQSLLLFNFRASNVYISRPESTVIGPCCEASEVCCLPDMSTTTRPTCAPSIEQCPQATHPLSPPLIDKWTRVNILDPAENTNPRRIVSHSAPPASWPCNLHIWSLSSLLHHRSTILTVFNLLHTSNTTYTEQWVWLNWLDQDTVQADTFWRKTIKNQRGTMKHHSGTMKTGHEPWKTGLEPCNTNQDPWKTMKTGLEPWKTNIEPWKANLEP